MTSPSLRTRLDADQVMRGAYDEANQRLRVDAEVTANVATMNVDILASSGDNIAIASQNGANVLTVNPDGSLDVNINAININHSTDSIKIGDGTNLLDVNPNGSINVVVTSSGLTTSNIFNEVLAVATGIATIIVSFTAITNTKLLKVDMGGGNVAAYSLSIAGFLQNKKYTFYQNLNEVMDFKDGIPVNAGDVISLSVSHNRPSLADFNGSLLIQS